MLMNTEVHAKNQLTAPNSSKANLGPPEAFAGRKPAAPLLATPTSGRLMPPKASIVRPAVVPATAEVKKISTGLMLAQCYNSETDDEDDEDMDNNSKPKTDNRLEAAVVYGKSFADF